MDHGANCISAFRINSSISAFNFFTQWLWPVGRDYFPGFYFRFLPDVHFMVEEYGFSFSPVLI
jgi:hypothetical protein